MKQPTAQNPAGHAHYMRPLDGIRGLACMLVIVSHIAQILQLNFVHDIYNFGSMGVVVFFVLSGFLMSTLYCDERFTLDATGKYSIARFARIAPAYWIAILFAWMIYMIIPDYHYQMTPFQMLRSVFFGGNQGVFWSIPPEIQFYGFFLLLWFSYQQSKQGKHIWSIISAIICMACVATKEMWGGLMLPSKLDLFLAGFFGAFLVKNMKIKPILCSIPFQIGIVAAWIGYSWCILEKDMIFQDWLLPVIVMMMVASLSQSSFLTKPLETETMRMMGAASFSIYLFHDAILYAMHQGGMLDNTQTTIAIAIMCFLSVALPVAFHYAVEKRLNISSKKWLLEKFEVLKAKYPKLSF